MKRGRSDRMRPAKTRPAVRPSLRRQLGFVAVAVVALVVGYLAAGWIAGETPSSGPGGETMQIPERAEGTAWYKSQKPPPTLVTAPDLPIFPEPNGAAESNAPRRAYEEALPADVLDEPPAPPVSLETGAVEPRSTKGSSASTLPQPSNDAGTSEGEAGSWRQYAVAVPDPGDSPMIAIVIDDMGMDRKRSALAARLPGPLTLSFLTYADDLARQGAAARAAGHELMLHVSMEPASKSVDPGPNVLLSSDTPDEIRRRLNWGLDRLSGFVGINNHMGSRFTEDRAGMDVVMSELKARGLLFLDSRTTPRSVGALVAREAGVPAAQRNVFLDNVNEVAAVKARLAETERVARRTGAAIAIGHPRDATLRALAEWVPTLSERGFALVPISAIVRAAIDGGSG